MNVFQTNVTLARAPEVAAVAAIQAGQSDLLVRQASVNAAREASHKQDQVAVAGPAETAAAIDLDQRSSAEKQRRGTRKTKVGAESPALPDVRSGYSPFGVGRRLDLVI